MGQQRLSFLSVRSIENDRVTNSGLQTEGGRGRRPYRHPRQRGIKRMKSQKLKGCNWSFFLLHSC